MAKWKCEICGNEFDNFHAQGFDNKIYCPLCYFKKENQELKSQLAGTTHCFDEEEHRKLKDEIKKLERIIELCHLDAKETLATINYEQESQQKEFIKYLEDEIYSIEPKGTGINYNCEYDSEEDYVMAMQEQSRLNTLKEILKKYKSITGVSDEKK